jgi:hypothetical protein
MTKMAVPPPYLVRLFNRIDAADASSELLHLALVFWRGKRGEHVLPTEADVAPAPAPIMAGTFLFRRSSAKAREWDIVEMGSKAAALLGLPSRDHRLSKLMEPRIAVRLRRLFEIATESAEPAAAMFETHDKTGHREWIEILAAPLSTNAINVDGIFGGITSRLETTTPSARK